MYQPPPSIDRSVPSLLKRFYREPKARPLDRVACFLILFGVVPLYGFMIFSTSGPMLLAIRIALLLLGVSMIVRTVAEALPKGWIYQAFVLRVFGVSCGILSTIPALIGWLTLRGVL